MPVLFPLPSVSVVLSELWLLTPNRRSDDKNATYLIDQLRVIPSRIVLLLTRRIKRSLQQSDLPQHRVPWLLQRSPADSGTAASRYITRQALSRSSQELHVWYGHNSPNPKNVRQDLVREPRGSRNQVIPLQRLRLGAREVGSTVLDGMVRRDSSPILCQRIQHSHPAGFEVKGLMEGLLTTVPGGSLPSYRSRCEAFLRKRPRVSRIAQERRKHQQWNQTISARVAVRLLGL